MLKLYYFNLNYLLKKIRLVVKIARLTWKVLTLMEPVSMHFPTFPFVANNGTNPKPPRVDKPHPASIACTRSAPEVAGSAWKNVTQVVGNCPCITDGDNRKFSQDILNGYGVQSTSTGFLWSSSYRIWEPTDFNHPVIHN